MMMKRFFWCNLLILNALYAFSQTTIHIGRASQTVKVDGLLDEQIWQTAEKKTGFINAQPTEGDLAKDQTEVQLCFDEKYLYVAAKCYQDKSKYVVTSLRRDYAGGSTDLFGINFDTFKDKQNAFNFTVSPYNIQREGLVSNGADLNTDWDNKWLSAVKNEEKYWTVEIAIPFKTLRYKQSADDNRWLVNFTRFNQGLAATERSSWSPIPRQFNGNNINFSGEMIWDTPPPKAGKNIALIPYVSGAYDKDNIAKTPLKSNLNIGGDAKFAITNALNLDLTFNPDFAQVEVDRQQTNLSRFELLFPERRQFFIENSDLFGTFGFQNANPLFTRRIGLSKDAAGNNVTVPILAGARMTGRLNAKWRVGVMDIQTGARERLNLAGNNFFATAVQRKVLKRSNLAFIFINKQNFQLDSTQNNQFSPDWDKFNRVAGLDFNYFNSNNSLKGKAFFHSSFSNIAAENPFSTAVFGEYRTRKWFFLNGVTAIGKGYVAETGYVPRTDIFRIYPNGHFVKWVENKKILSWEIGFDADFHWRLSDMKFSDYDYSPLVFRLNMQSGARLSLTPYRVDYTYLFNNFDPTNTGGKSLLKQTDYTYRSLRYSYNSDYRKRFNVTVNGRFGEYFNGKINNIQTILNYRYQPYLVASLDINYNKINLPEGYNDRELWLVGPRFDFSFTNSLFFTTFFQYNNQINNFNLNTRLQWRFAPMSDLFVVYSDNYFAQDDFTNPITPYQAFDSKNRSLVLKCSYWLNL